MESRFYTQCKLIQNLISVEEKKVKALDTTKQMFYNKRNFEIGCDNYE